MALWRGMALEQYISQCFGNNIDLTHGRQMPCHYSDGPTHYVSLSSPIGTQISHACGAARSDPLGKSVRERIRITKAVDPSEARIPKIPPAREFEPQRPEGVVAGDSRHYAHARPKLGSEPRPKDAIPKDSIELPTGGFPCRDCRAFGSSTSVAGFPART